MSDDLTTLIPDKFWDDTKESPTARFSAPGISPGLLFLEATPGHLLLESGTTDALFLE